MIQETKPFSTLTVFTSRPQAGTKFLIVRNLKHLLQHAYLETRFNNASLLRTKAFQQLKNIVFIAEDAIQPYLNQLILKLSQLYSQESDNQENKKIILETAQILGMSIKFQVAFLVILDLLKPQMTQQNTDSSPRMATNILLILSKIMIHQKQTDLQSERNNLFGVISTFATKFNENDEGLFSLLRLTEILLVKIRQINDNNQTSILFNLLLNIQSTNSISSSIKNQAQQVNSLLSNKCGCNSISELNAQQVGPIFQKIIQSKSYVQWNKTSKQRFQFDRLVRNCRQIIPRYMSMIIEILQSNVKSDNDLELRMDTHVLIGHIFGIKQIHADLKQYATIIMKTILIPSIRWKIGAPEAKIRQIGVFNMTTLIKEQIIEQKGIIQCCTELLPPLKDCLTDDRQPLLRKGSLELIEHLLIPVQQEIDQQFLRNLYVSLLERLNDSKDQLRIQATLCINMILGCTNLNSTIFEYIVLDLFIHFDESNEELRDKVFVSLKHAARVNVKYVLQKANVHLKKMMHTSICQKLIAFCKQLEQ